MGKLIYNKAFGQPSTFIQAPTILAYGFDDYIIVAVEPLQNIDNGNVQIQINDSGWINIGQTNNEVDVFIHLLPNLIPLQNYQIFARIEKNNSFSGISLLNTATESNIIGIQNLLGNVNAFKKVTQSQIVMTKLTESKVIMDEIVQSQIALTELFLNSNSRQVMWGSPVAEKSLRDNSNAIEFIKSNFGILRTAGGQAQIFATIQLGPVFCLRGFSGVPSTSGDQGARRFKHFQDGVTAAEMFQSNTGQDWDLLVGRMLEDFQYIAQVSNSSSRGRQAEIVIME